MVFKIVTEWKPVTTVIESPTTSLEDDDEGDSEILILFSSDAEIHVLGEPAMAGITR